MNLLHIQGPKETPANSEKTEPNVTENQVVPYECNEDPFMNDPDMPSDFDLMEYVSQLQNDEENSMVVSSTQHANKEISTTTTSYQD